MLGGVHLRSEISRLSLAVTSLTQGRSQETGSSVEKYAQDLQPSLTSIQTSETVSVWKSLPFIIRVLVFPVSSQAGNITNTASVVVFGTFSYHPSWNQEEIKQHFKRYHIQSKK